MRIKIQFFENCFQKINIKQPKVLLFDLFKRASLWKHVP